jgi:hypothetical protein
MEQQQQTYQSLALDVFLECFTQDEKIRLQFLRQKQTDLGWKTDLFVSNLRAAANLVLEPIEQKYQETAYRHTMAGAEPPEHYSHPIYPGISTKFRGHIFTGDIQAIRAMIDNFEQAYSNYRTEQGTAGNIDYCYYYKKEVTPERKQEVRDQLAKLKTDAEKLDYLRDAQKLYRQDLPPEILEVSGNVKMANVEPGTPLFFDRFLQLEIDAIQERLAGGKKPTIKSETQYPERETRQVIALFHYYNGIRVTRDTHGSTIYRMWIDWRKTENRTKPGGNLEYPTKKRHLISVIDWLLSEGNRKDASKAQRDLDTLNSNAAKL